MTQATIHHIQKQAPAHQYHHHHGGRPVENGGAGYHDSRHNQVLGSHQNGEDSCYSPGIPGSGIPDNVGTQDMTTLSNLTVEEINANLKERYQADLVYTYTGTILISVNPYKYLSIYGTNDIARYHEDASCTTPPPPHIFAIAEQAYNSLIRSYDEAHNRTTNQSVVISGESGAGKTETTKFILQYLCHVTSNVSTWVENQILEANTILEAFGNAKTIRNDNSSRFGKFMQVCFDSKWMIRGCIIQDYLLEQSRITFQSEGERNYHVFYQLITAARQSMDISDQYALNQHSPNPTIFSYLQNQHDHSTSLDPLLLALQVLQIPATHVTGLFSTLSAILHLGNLVFTPGEDGETATLTESDKILITTISRLLQVDELEFIHVLLTRQINVRGNITEIPLRVNEGSENRHAMSKALYSRCFGWLIGHINERTNPGADTSKVIGLLDIFGFENFGVNSFEQMCINYANEKLHKFFNQAVFSIEQEIYRAEGLNISEIRFTDNNAILELIEKPPRCILKLLTEQCHLPKGSDLGFLNNLHSEFDTVHPCYEKGDDRRNWEKRFTIKHYAGNVAYHVQGFVEKNRDVQQDLFFNTLGESRHEFVRCLANSLFDDQLKVGSTTIPRNTSKGRPTVAETFRGQLQQLVEVLGNTKAWYVRCIKPNEDKTPETYDEALVMEQLKYLGMLEIIRIRKEGYPVHMPFDEFSKRYRVTGKFRTYKGARDTTQHILESFNPELPPPPSRTSSSSSKSTTYLKAQSLPPYYYQLGNTKAFLKPQMHELLEQKRSAVITRHVTTIQKTYRCYKARTHYTVLRAACIIIQRAYRSWTSRLMFLKKKRAAITIQCHIRGFFAREVAVALREMRRVEKELRKREIEAERRKSLLHSNNADLSSDDGRESRSVTSDEDAAAVVGGNKDVSLDNLFEFLLVNSGKKNNDEDEYNNAGQTFGCAAAAPGGVGTTKPSGSSGQQQLDKISYEMDTLVNDLNGLEVGSTSRGAGNGSGTNSVAGTTVTNSNSVCSSMSNFEIDNDAEFDADESVIGEEEDDEDDDDDDLDKRSSLVCTPTNDSGVATTTSSSNKFILPPPPPSPPPLMAPPENIPVVAKKVAVNHHRLPESTEGVSHHNRLPEPTCPPPPPPVATSAASVATGLKQQQLKQNLTQQQKHQQSTQQQQHPQVSSKVPAPGSSGSKKPGPPDRSNMSRQDEPIYESIRPRIPPPENFGSGPGAPQSHYHGNQQVQQQQQQHKMSKQMSGLVMSSCPSTSSPTKQSLGGTNGFVGPPPPPPIPEMYNKPMVQQPQQLVAPQQQQQQQQQPVAAPLVQPLPSRVEKRVQEIIQQQGAVTSAPSKKPPVAQVTTTPSIREQQQVGSSASDPSEIVTLKQYAVQYFSLENRKQSQSQEDYINEHTSYTKSSHVSHPHIHLYDPSNIQVSCFMFRDLNKLMKGELKPELENQALQTIIGYGIEREELRDEIYVQVLRQINGNGSIEYLERLYLVFCLAIVSFPPGKVLSRVVNYELSSISNGNAKLASQIKWILDNLQLAALKIRGYVRKLPPSSVEIQAMKRLGTIVCRFFFLDGRTKAIDIHPTDTAYDAIIKLGEKIGVGSPQSLVENGWAVFQVRPNERVEEHVPLHTYVYDVIAHWELANTDKNSGVSLGCGDNRFVFKKRLFKGNSREIPQDPVECTLLYAQAVFSVVKRDDYPVAEKVSLQLAGLQSQVLFGEPPSQQKSFDNYTNIESFLPVRIARTRPHASWVPILAQAHRTYGAGKSELVARVWYLSCVMQYPLYGTTMFHVVYRGYWVYGNSLVLGISSDGITMIKSDDKFIMYEYAYNQIESVSIEPQERLLTITLNRSLPPDTHKCFVFETNHTSEVAALISSYCPALASSRNVSNNNVAKPNTVAHQLTNQDRMRLYGNVLNSRKQLIDSGLLKRPEKGLAGVTFLKNTLRRLSKHKIERMRQYEHAMMTEKSSGNGGPPGSSDEQEFPLEWFCYTKHAISTSLTNLPQPELESTAVWMFNQLISFSSYNPTSGGSATGTPGTNSPMKSSSNSNSNSNQAQQPDNSTELHAATVLQGIFEKVWRSDPLINELYVQVIKQTTDHPEPNSRVNARNWGVLSLICSVIAPPDPSVRKYLNSHLKRCAITDFVTEEGKFARFAEKCLQHTISSSSVSPTSRRQWPPSRNEIICTVNRKPITARFHFMDGKYHTLQFAPNDTAADLIVSLTMKIGLPQGVKGYSIYEVSTSPIQLPHQHQNSSPNGSQPGHSQPNVPATPWERSLMPQEKPVEVIARWERQKANHQSTTTSSSSSTTPLFKFIIRKHLYESLDLSNPIEKELVYHQLLSSARNDRFPVNDTEAAMLVALQAQVELGDYASSSAGEFPDYCHVSAHCLPTRIAALVSHEAVARHHQSLVGTPSGQAKQAVLNLLMSWPLFRCIVFDVTQSFTSNWPRNLWLALDNTGLHLLPQRTRHTLCTFEYSNIKSYSPSPTCFMLVTRGANSSISGSGMMQGNSNKIVLSTNQAYQVAQLIKEFVYSSMQQQQQASNRG